MALDFLNFIIFVSLIVFCTSQETCEKKDVCSCTFKNGSTVNLRPVDDPKAPSFTKIPSHDQSGRTFDWNPCTPFDTDNGCKKTLVCQVMNPDKNAGTVDTTFSVNSEGNVVIAYGGSKDPLKDYIRKSEITLKCDPSVPGKGTIPEFKETKPDDKTSVYSATFTSKYACPIAGTNGSHLRVGSILLIIFFPLVLMYVVIGILVNRYGRGIESMPELFPNHSFWADFPFLVKDGVVFTFGCIKSACSSLSQKCGKDGYAEI